ncbi:MAG: zinc ribbon domain-containing protein [Chloroflexi bacterium]|nr:zinc ribbon domain-containing protein [Chloroflexota bacterium]
MSEIQRICPQCGKSSALDAQFCAHCGYDTQAGLPAPRQMLPATIGKAALPILAGVASLAIRAGWKLVQNYLAQSAANNTIVVPKTPSAPPQTTPLAARQETPTTRRPRRTIHIRSSWATGDANGLWQRGTSEHTIEIED